MDIECNGFKFVSDFDSGNLGRVEFLSEKVVGEDKIYEFNIWTRPDCAGTEFANGNRTWFYFGLCEAPEVCTIKFNVVMNKQSKMYGQGMAPVYCVIPGQPIWERIKDRPTFMVVQAENGDFLLSFHHRLTDLTKSNTTIYFAFTYPFSYNDLENFLDSLELSQNVNICAEPVSYEKVKSFNLDDVYYHREVLCKSLEGRKVNLVTITSLHNITPVREVRLNNLFLDESIPRPYKFNKKVIFLSARVHPGETPSSFVLNGIMKYLMTSNDLPAILLRKYYVFKIIPMLNPDGVYNGHYRTDTRGTNLNRVYNNPSLQYHPSIYGARAVLLYYHYGKEKFEGLPIPDGDSLSVPNRIARIEYGVSDLTLEKQGILKNTANLEYKNNELSSTKSFVGECGGTDRSSMPLMVPGRYSSEPLESGLFLYIDMHGHASKKGIFMYGNHFQDLFNNVECRLFPKLISINSQHFHFDSCNFSERNMYAKDKRDGSSREGSGRVSVSKATGLVRCYTLECNYNTGKKVNQLPPLSNMYDKRLPLTNTNPPKYTPAIYEETGRQIVISILDLNNQNPWTRLTQSSYRSLASLRENLRIRVLSENSRSIPREKNSSHLNKVCRGETRPWKRPKTAAMIAALNSNTTTAVAAGSSTVTPSHKKLRPTLKRTKSSNEPPQSRLEKKSSGDNRRLMPEQRRKKLKPK